MFNVLHPSPHDSRTHQLTLGQYASREAGVGVRHVFRGLGSGDNFLTVGETKEGERLG